MTASVLLDGETIRDAFRHWDEGQQPIDAELSESLAALSAFQAHLDAWQQDLSRERNELRAERERLAHDQSSAEQDQTRLSELTAEADASREQVNELTALLVSRTEELLVLESRRGEAATELELSRSRESELRASLDEIKQSYEQERVEWTEQTRRLGELLEQRLESAPAPSQTNREEPTQAEHRSAQRPAEKQATDNPVLASVMEQFGKLRQQRALDRPALKKGR